MGSELTVMSNVALLPAAIEVTVGLTPSAKKREKSKPMAKVSGHALAL
jgi:hypothetical protein